MNEFVGRTAAFLGMLLATAPAAGADMSGTVTGDAEAGKVLASEHCQDCHGSDGIGTAPDRPDLAGQKALYLETQLRALRDSAWDREARQGRTGRRHGVMGENIILYSDDQISDLAAHYSGLACSQPGGKAADRPAVVNSCSLCHGVNGLSAHPAVPNLAGQKPGYLAAQLRRFRMTGHDEFSALSPESRANPVMDNQAKRLSDEQISSVAAWFAGLPCR